MSTTIGIYLSLYTAGYPYGYSSGQNLPLYNKQVYCDSPGPSGGSQPNNDPISMTTYPASVPINIQAGQPAKYFYPQTIQAVVTFPGNAESFAAILQYGDSTNGGLADYTYQGNTYPIGPTAPALAPTSAVCTLDSHRRPLAALANPSGGSGGSGTGALGYCSNDAGHSFLSSVIDADATCTDISLLVDQKQNHFSAIYTKGAPGSTGIYSAFGSITDSFAPDSAPAAAGISGTNSIAAQHPTDKEFTLLLLLSGGTLAAAQSSDYGRRWTAAGTVATGLDFSSSGRAGLAWLGETAFAVYASGSSLLCAQSIDRGQTWSAAKAVPASVASAGPYSGVSLLGWQGTLYPVAFAGSPAAPVLLRSSGAAWAPTLGALPGITIPSAIGVLPLNGQLRLGVSHHSSDDGQSWIGN